MGLVDAGDPAPARVAPAERVEVEPGDVVVGNAGAEATPAGRTGDRGAMAVTNRQWSLELVIGRMDHRRPFCADNETASDGAVIA